VTAQGRRGHDQDRDQRRGVRGDCPDAPARQRGYEAEPNEQGDRTVWLEEAMADRLGAMRGPGESFSDAILRLAKATTQTKRTKVKR
jgi:hypothetical protein